MFKLSLPTWLLHPLLEIYFENQLEYSARELLVAYCSNVSYIEHGTLEISDLPLCFIQNLIQSTDVLLLQPYFLVQMQVAWNCITAFVLTMGIYGVLQVHLPYKDLANQDN